MKVNIDELQEITNLLLAKLKSSKGNEIELKSDFYWDIPMNEAYSPYDEPKNLSLGQLSDDLNEVRRVLNSDDAIPYDLKRLAELMKAISVENQTAF